MLLLIALPLSISAVAVAAGAVATVEGDRIVVRRLADSGALEEVEVICPGAPAAPGSAASGASFGGRRHLYYARSDGAIGHLVGAEDGGDVAWKDDGRVVAAGSSPRVVASHDKTPWLFYDSGAFVIAVRLGVQTGRVGIPLETLPVAPAGPFAILRRADRLWLVRPDGPWVVAAPMLDEKPGAPAPVRIAFRPEGFTPVGAGTAADVDCVVERTEGGLVASPLIWPGADAPLLDDRGTLGAWTGGSPDPAVVPGPWLHRVDDHAPGWIDFGEDGRIDIPDADVRWELDGRDLLLTWPSGSAPGGAWRDRCLLSADGTRYRGRNQHRNLIRGSTTAAGTAIARQACHPLLRLPIRVKAAAGRLTLFSDFGDVRGARIVLYLVNRTKEPVMIQTQDGAPFIKIEGKAADGTWERAETHLFSDCGNSYMVTPELPPGHFFRVLGLYPLKGEEREVRYRVHRMLDLVSNAGPGRVDPEAIRICRTDRIAIDEGDFDQVAAIALGEVEILAEDWLDLRKHAIERLPRFKGANWRKVLRVLSDDSDPKVRELAERLLSRR